MRGKQGGFKQEKIDEITNITFRQQCSLQGTPSLKTKEFPSKISKKKIFRQYMKCSKKNFELWDDKNEKGTLAS